MGVCGGGGLCWWNGVRRESEADEVGVSGGQEGFSWRDTEGANLEWSVLKHASPVPVS